MSEPNDVSPQRRAMRPRIFGIRRWLLWVWIVISMGALLTPLCFVGVVPPGSRTAGTMYDIAERLGHVVRRDGKLPGDIASVSDEWGSPITARCLPDGTVELLSLGRDGKPGGTGEDADLRGVFDPNGSPPDRWIMRPGSR